MADGPDKSDLSIKAGIHIDHEDRDEEPVIEGDESSRLRALDAAVRDQDDLERDIGRQVNLLTLRYQSCY